MSIMFNEVLARLSTERDRDNFKWLYEATRDGDVSTLIHGMMMSIVLDHPKASYFEIVQQVREKLAVYKTDNPKKQEENQNES